MIRLKIISSLSLFLLIVILSGCTNNIKTNKDISNKDFLVGIDEIKNIKVNEAFEINGYLKNSSKQTFDITHGSGMFTYEIYDGDGGEVYPNRTILYQNDIGYSVQIKSNEEYRNNGDGQRSMEYYQFTIQKPGRYKVKTNVVFSIKNEENQINISSDLKEFTVE